MRVVIPGGSGQLGRMLSRHFQADGHDVTVLTRRPIPAPWLELHWDGETADDWVDYLDGADVCINLAGRGVNCRYNAANRRAVLQSRIRSTRLLNQVIASLPNPPGVWLNASTANIYRHSLDRPMDELTGELGGSEPGAWGFSVDAAKAWEAAFFETPTPRTRKIALRSAWTLSPESGGVFGLLLRLVRHGLGGRHATGHQFVSWIHHVDFVRAVSFLIANRQLDGIVNLASPNPLTNAEFMQELRWATAVPIGLSWPRWLLEIGSWLLRTESELMLKSRRVVPGRLLAAGFQFEFPDWAAAAQDLAGQGTGHE